LREETLQKERSILVFELLKGRFILQLGKLVLVVLSSMFIGNQDFFSKKHEFEFEVFSALFEVFQGYSFLFNKYSII
jgi:hypothetical protein